MSERVSFLLSSVIAMTEKKQRELHDLLKEGISALREMRRGLKNACVELRSVYSNLHHPDAKGPKLGIAKDNRRHSRETRIA